MPEKFDYTGWTPKMRFLSQEIASHMSRYNDVTISKDMREMSIRKADTLVGELLRLQEKCYPAFDKV